MRHRPFQLRISLSLSPPNSKTLQLFSWLLALGLMLLVQGGCVFEPLSLINLPCSSNSDCGTGTCQGKVCTDGTGKPSGCSQTQPCLCGTCDTDKKTCKPLLCKADTDCASCKDGFCNTQKGVCAIGSKVKPSCRSAADCTSRLCVSGQCLNCKEDRDCPSALCVSGTCKECTTEGDCNNGRLCKNKVCSDCQSDDDCSSKLCLSGGCKPCTSDKDCSAGRLCKNKVCTKCSVNEDCPTFLCSNGACKSCTKNSECGAGECQSGRCAKPCSNNQDCVNTTGLCQQGRCVPCRKAEDCVDSLRCIDNRCASPCQSTTDCLTGRICETGKCRLPKEGETCTPLVGCTNQLSCINEAGTASCRQTCDPLAATNKCPTGQLCAYQPSDNKDVNGICKPANGGETLGKDCKSKACEVNLFCKEDGPTKLCRKFCQTQKPSSCGRNEVCVGITPQNPLIGVCLPQVCKGSVGNCTIGFQCYKDACRKSCNPKLQTNACASKAFCFALPSSAGGVCLDKQCGGGETSTATCNISNFCEDFQCKEVKPIPKTCLRHRDCRSSELCVQITSTQSACRAKCSYRKAGACSSLTGHLCTSLPNPTTTSTGICMPKRGGGGLGVSCKIGTITCERDHFCVPITSKRSVCLPLCSYAITSPKPDAQCPTKFQCKFSIQRTRWGVCVNTGKVLRLNEECGPTLGICPTNHECIVDSKTDKTFCRKTCTSSSNCSANHICTSVKSAVLAASIKACIPK